MKALVLLGCLALCAPAGAASLALESGFLYARPLSPLNFSQSNPNGFGFSGMLEYQPHGPFSLGLQYDGATFQGHRNITAGSFDLLARLRALSYSNFSPYLLAFAGLNPAYNQDPDWPGRYHAGMGMGSFFYFLDTWAFDLGIGYHFFTPLNFSLNDFDVHAGLRWSWDLNSLASWGAPSVASPQPDSGQVSSAFHWGDNAPIVVAAQYRASLKAGDGGAEVDFRSIDENYFEFYTAKDWILQILDSGPSAAVLGVVRGDGRVPSRLVWDGKDPQGQPVPMLSKRKLAWTLLIQDVDGSSRLSKGSVEPDEEE